MLEEWDEPLLPSMSSFKASPERKTVQVMAVGSNNLKKGELQKLYLDRMASIDCVIQAVSPFAAARLSATQERFYVGYTAVWNLLVTTADRDLDKARDLSDFQCLNELDAKVQAEYDPDIYHGAPVSLQIVGRRLEEEMVLDMVEVVAKALEQQR
ncbi:hypothetical protein FOPE_07688 [Fonsecaea pedrosoi]|nr:hypothetical protein FOPE_07688 [Fonsecaea pedrosoi]